MTNEMIIEAVRSAMAVQPVMQPIRLEATTVAADPAVVAKFEEAMRTADVSPAQLVPPAEKVHDIPFAGRAEAAFMAAQDNNQGIMSRIHALSAEGGRTLTMPELMELQYEVANLSFQQDLVTKVIDRASTAIQTLVKNQ